MPVICKFAAFSLIRDLSDFGSYSPLFNEAYVRSFETRIMEVTKLVEPKSETVQLKPITERLYGSIDD